MRKFNLEEAKNGAKVQTRYGFEARIICFDRNLGEFPIVALIGSDNGTESVIEYSSDGRYNRGLGDQNPIDLVMAPAEIFVNLYFNSDGDQVAYHEFAHYSELAACHKGDKVVEAYFDIVSFITLKGEV